MEQHPRRIRHYPKKAFKNYVHEFKLSLVHTADVYVEALIILKRIKKPCENCSSLSPLLQSNL